MGDAERRGRGALRRPDDGAGPARGAPVRRAAVTTGVSGVLYSGLDLTKKTNAKKVAESGAEIASGLCRGARMELNPQDGAAIRAWVGGGLLKG